MNRKLILVVVILLVALPCWGGVDFDGIDDILIESSDPALTGNKFSIFSIVRIDALPVVGDAFIHTIYTNDGVSSVDGVELRLGLDGTDGGKDNFHCHQVNSDNSPTRSSVNSTLVVSTGVWYSIFCWNSSNAINIKVCDLETSSCTETTGDSTSGESIKTVSGTDIGSRSGGRFWDGVIDSLVVWDDQVVRVPFEDSLESGYKKRLVCQSQPEDLVLYLILDECANGKDCDGKIFQSPCNVSITASGDNGANNTGLSGAGIELLNYP